jgi:hypothetical protein
MTNLAKCFNSASFFLSIFVERWICAVGFRVRHNVLGLCEVADFKAQMFNLALNFNRITTVQFSTEPAILQNPC